MPVPVVEFSSNELRALVGVFQGARLRNGETFADTLRRTRAARWLEDDAAVEAFAEKLGRVAVEMNEGRPPRAL